MYQVEINALHYVKNVHMYFGYEPDPWRLAHRMGLVVTWGADTCLDGKVIILGPECRVSRKAAAGAIRHEIAHYLVQRSGAEREILKRAGTYELGLHYIEQLAFHADLILHIPDFVYREAIRVNGHMPAAILHMCEKTDADLADALRRWVYAEVGEKRGAFVQKFRLIVDIAAANVWLPFWRYDEVDDPLADLPTAHLLDLPQDYGKNYVLGVVGW